MSDGLNIDTRTAQIQGLDGAIIEGLEDQYRQAFDAGLIDEISIRAALGTTREILRSGPIMVYLALLRDEASEAIKGFAHVDPTNMAEIIRAQRAISRFEHLLEWMKGAIAQKPQKPSAESFAEDA